MSALVLHVNLDSGGRHSVSLGGHPAFTTRIAGPKASGLTKSILTFYPDIEEMKKVIDDHDGWSSYRAEIDRLNAVMLATAEILERDGDKNHLGGMLRCAMTQQVPNLEQATDDQ
jgi:hypothetical protein